LGGLALAAPEAMRMLVAAGFPLVLVETVGVGQVEVEIADSADTTVVVVNPGWGDNIQASKAGLLEIADVFVVNKADRPGAAEARRDLEQMLDLSFTMGDWRPPIHLVSANSGEGVDGLWAALSEHRAYLDSSGERERRRARHLRDELAAVLLRRLEERVRGAAGGQAFDRVAGEVVAYRVDPYDGAEELLAGG
jgi:LAO/AO transport system kinase